MLQNNKYLHIHTNTHRMMQQQQQWLRPTVCFECVIVVEFGGNRNTYREHCMLHPNEYSKAKRTPTKFTTLKKKKEKKPP